MHGLLSRMHQLQEVSFSMNETLHNKLYQFQSNDKDSNQAKVQLAGFSSLTANQ